MPSVKMKTHKGLRNRVRVSARGKVKHKKSGTSHRMAAFNGKRRRHHRRTMLMPLSVAKKMEVLLGERLTGPEKSD